MATKRAKPRHIEGEIQKAIIRWRNYNLIEMPELRWLHAVPNGGGRSKIEAGILKAEGVTKGVWDLALPVRRGPYVGFASELKNPALAGHKNGGLTDEQVDYGEHLRANGWCTLVGYDWAVVVEAIRTYMRLPKP